MLNPNSEKINSVKLKDIETEDFDICEITDPKGIILGRAENEDKAATLSRSEKRNSNILVLGPAGSGKTYSFAIPNTLNAIKEKKSVFVTDPNGEIMEATKAAAEKNGYTVRVLNLKDPEKSDKWNPIDILANAGKKDIDELAEFMAETILENADEPEDMATPFFQQSEKHLLTTLLLYVATSPKFDAEGEKKTLGRVYDLLGEMLENKQDPCSVLEIEKDDPLYTSKKLIAAAGKLIFTSICGLLGKLEPLKDEKIREILSGSDIRHGELRTERCIHYLIPSFPGKSYKMIPALFLGCELEAAKKHTKEDNSLEVVFVLDAPEATGTPENITRKIINAKEAEISVFLLAHDIRELSNVYGPATPLIMSGCDTWVVYGVNEPKTANLLATRSGIATYVGALKDYLADKEHRQSEAARPIMNSDELYAFFERNTDERKALIFRRGAKPLVVKAYGWPIHKLAEKDGDA